MKNSWLVNELKLKPYEYWMLCHSMQLTWNKINTTFLKCQCGIRPILNEKPRKNHQKREKTIVWLKKSNRNWQDETRRAREDQNRNAGNKNVSKWIEALLFHAHRMYAAYTKSLDAHIVSTVSNRFESTFCHSNVCLMLNEVCLIHFALHLFFSLSLSPTRLSFAGASVW